MNPLVNIPEQKDPTILIVDDDVAIRNLMKEFIETVGYKTGTASDAEEALELFKDNNFEIVITDIMMPGMDGLELTELLKKNHDTEIIVMTGYSGDYSYQDAIDKGASDFVFKPVRFEELLLRIKRVLKERGMIHELQRLAITDSLTKLFNSRHFYNQLETETKRSGRYNRPLALLLIDIDFFKNYNDTYGHIEGDKVLARFGRIVLSCLRKSDSAYRYGGEEFTVILPETNGIEAMHVARRIKSAIEEQKFLPMAETPVYLTISAGVTAYCQGEPLTSFIKRADQAMYTSKQRGRNKITTLFIDETSTPDENG
ncbi:MAG: diguanylate cyclase [Desulfobacteraceae bacterium]|nr:diguanylate cyclase [Desulfobacteraceae bacterium]